MPPRGGAGEDHPWLRGSAVRDGLRVRRADAWSGGGAGTRQRRGGDPPGAGGWRHERPARYTIYTIGRTASAATPMATATHALVSVPTR